MDISKTSNMFICLAEARSRAGEDMEDVAKELARALKAIISEGLGKENKETIMAEFAFLCCFTVDSSHRYSKEC